MAVVTPLLVGTVLLALWAWWSVQVLPNLSAVTVSLLVQVRADADVDPCLRLICQSFHQSIHIRLLEIWVLTEGDDGQVARVVQRLDGSTDLWHLHAVGAEGPLDLARAHGQLLVFLDLVERLTPQAAVQAVQRLLTVGPVTNGTVVLSSGG